MDETENPLDSTAPRSEEIEQSPPHPEPTQVTASEESVQKRNIVKELRRQLFSNPWKGIKAYFKRVRMFFSLSFLQFRNPTCHLVGNESEFLGDGTPEGKGVIFPILFRILNPLGGTKEEKIQKIHQGYVNYAKECISLLVAAVLIQLAFSEFAGQSTAGNMEVAFYNSIILVVFFISILIYGVIARIVTRKVTNLKSKYLLQESFIFEICMIFAIVVFITMLEAFGIINMGNDPGAILALAFLVPVFHPFYMLLAINKKVKITTFFGVIGWGAILGFVGSSTLLTALAISAVAGSFG